MKNYIDKYGRIHEKENKLSNNGWIYSAYAQKAGLIIDITHAHMYDCYQNFERHPYIVSNPPISRDEILGLSYFLPNSMCKKLLERNWDFCPYDKPRFNLIKLINQLKECYGKNRNYFWKNDKSQIYHIAFKVPLQDRHYILKNAGKYNFVYHLIHLLDQLIPTKNRSVLAIKWLKGNRKNSDIIQYFDSNHPIVKHLNNL